MEESQSISMYKKASRLQGCIGKIARLNDGSYEWGKSNIQQVFKNSQQSHRKSSDKYDSTLNECHSLVRKKNATSIEQCQVVETKNILSVCDKVIEVTLQRNC